jgi:putative tricarboxylic transport membrane protein
VKAQKMLDFVTSLTIGLPLILKPSILLFAFLGSLIGLVVGALPGLTSAMAVSVMIPLTYSLSPEQAFALLLPAYAAGTFGGSIGAILLNIPGTGAAIMTAFDGYPMRLRGEAGRAIGIAATSSLIGGLASALFLVAAAPIAAKWAIQLGSHEYFAIAIFGLAIIAYISPSIVKGLTAGAFGLLLATVGNDPAGAFPRFTFDEPALVGGLTFVPVMIGLFGLAEVFWALENKITAQQPVRQEISGTMKSAWEVLKNYPVLIRSTVIGLFVGIMPASGPTIGSVVSYGAEKRIGKNRDKMGDGAPEGIIAAEAANNSGTGGALVPMMALGIPGDAVTAILIGALLIHGLQPGPALFLDQPELVSSMFLLFILGNILFVAIGLIGLKWLLRILETPTKYLIPIILAFCVVGAFAASNSVFDIAVLIIFGVVGYVMRKMRMPVAPMVLGFILGPLIEDNLRRALILDDGSPFGFFTRPFSATLLVIIIIMLISPALSKLLLGRTVKLEE